MHDFVFKEIINANIEQEIEKIGYDKCHIKPVSSKFRYKNIKIYSLSNPQLNILKQTAISVGADCATHREVITNKIDSSDCILCGSVSQINKIADKLQFQPFGLKTLGLQLKDFCKTEKTNPTKIMGILNLTSNSFSDGGMYNDFDNAKNHLLELINDGADIIDIGAESTKPYSDQVSAENQLEKILPILDFINDNNIKIPISIDTRSAEVAQKCIEKGVQYVNDVSGLEYDTKMAEVIAKSDVKVIIQHSTGNSENIQNYENLMDEIYLDLKKKIDLAQSNGIKKENIIIDAGIGFGKTREQNFEIIKRIEELNGLDCPIALGISRKSLLNMPDASNNEKDIYTCALNTLAIERKVDIIRVHNVKMHKKLIELLAD